MNIVDFIPKGKENAVTREALCIYTGLDDRTVRKLIELARDGGAPILSSSHSVGYWLSDDIVEIKAFLNETDHRCKSMSRRAQISIHALRVEGDCKNIQICNAMLVHSAYKTVYFCDSCAFYLT